MFQLLIVRIMEWFKIFKLFLKLSFFGGHFTIYMSKIEIGSSILKLIN